MAVKYAFCSPNIYASCSARSSAASLIDFLKNAFVAGGWTASVISGGYELATTSPQSLAVRVQIKDLSGTQISVQMIGASVNGAIHNLAWMHGFNNIPPYGYQIVVHPAGFYISRPGISGDPEGSAVCGGIPFVSGNCGVGPAIPTELWYSFGDCVGSPFFSQQNPRINIDIGTAGLFGEQEGCLNGILYTINSWSATQILRISTHQLGQGPTLWIDNTDLVYEPLVAFATIDGGPMVIRGQMYNAVLRSSSAPMDMLRSFDGYNWINYTDLYQEGSLWLLKGQDIQIGNVAY